MNISDFVNVLVLDKTELALMVLLLSNVEEASNLPELVSVVVLEKTELCTYILVGWKLAEPSCATLTLKNPVSVNCFDAL